MKKVLYMGRKQVGADCLQWLIDGGGVEVVGVLTDSHLSVSPTSDVANSANIPLYDFQTALRLLQIGDLDFDLGLSMLYWRKLKNEFLTSPKLEVINFHPAPLPQYKGTAGYNIAILESLEKWAVSAHYVDDSIDTGPIIDHLRFKNLSGIGNGSFLRSNVSGTAFSSYSCKLQTLLLKMMGSYRQSPT